MNTKPTKKIIKWHLYHIWDKREHYGCQLAIVKNEAGVQAFGAHLQRLREARGWSREELANMADVARMTVYRVEKAQFAVSLDVFLSLAHALEISPKELMNFSELPK